MNLLPTTAPGDPLLLELARKHVWWKTPSEALEFPSRVVAQVMDRGSFDDINAIVGSYGEELLRETLRKAEAGQFTQRSWHYWHYRLGLAAPGQVPPLPVRVIP